VSTKPNPDVFAQLERLLEQPPVDEIRNRTLSKMRGRRPSWRDRQELEDSIPGTLRLVLPDVRDRVGELEPEEAREIVREATVRGLVQMYGRPREELLDARSDLRPDTGGGEPSPPVNLVARLLVELTGPVREPETGTVPPPPRRRARLRRALDVLDPSHGLDLDGPDLAFRATLVLGRWLAQLGPGSDRLRRDTRELVRTVRWALVDAAAQRMGQLFGIGRRTAVVATAKYLRISGVEAAQAWPAFFATRDVFYGAAHRLPADLRAALSQAAEEAGPIFAPPPSDA
jgi:hypothetical protein